MNVRVSAIILVAAIFMAVWDADQKGIAKDRQRIARARAAASSVASTDAGRTPVATTPVVPPVKTTTTALTVNSEPDHCIPLPSRLAAGTWQVVDETGRQTRVTIHSEPQTTSENSFCIVTGDRGRRWCFVRIPDQQTAELPSSGSQQ